MEKKAVEVDIGGFEELLYQKIQTYPSGVSMRELVDWVMKSHPEIINLKTPLDNLWRQERIVRLRGGKYRCRYGRSHA